MRLMMMSSLSVVISLLHGCYQPARNYLLSLWSNELTNWQKQTKDTTNLQFLSLILALSIWLIYILERWCWNTLATRICDDLKTKLYSRLLNSTYSWRENHSTYDSIRTLTNDMDMINEILCDKLGIVIRNSVTFIAGIYLALIACYPLCIIIFMSFPCVGLVLAIMNRKWRECDEREVKAYEQASTVAHDIIKYIKLVTSSNNLFNEYEKYKSLLKKVESEQIKTSWINGIGWGLYKFTMFFSFALAFYYGGKYVMSGNYTTGDTINTFTQLAVGITAVGNIAQPVAELKKGYKKYLEIQCYIHNCQQTSLIDIDKDLISKNSLENNSQTQFDLEGDITFESVWFRYPSREDVWILSNFNVTFVKNKNIAIVGCSGCGKSSLFQLLIRAYEPERGRILINGLNIKNIPIDILRKHVMLNTQTAGLFDGTIRDNIVMGAFESITDDHIEYISRISNSHQFITSKVDKYETLIETYRIELSGGELQRIALARALLVNSSVLLLDESTSALDPITENDTIEKVLKYRKNKTTLLITHRLNSLYNFDTIHLMENGQISMSGDLETILKMKQETLSKLSELGDDSSQKEQEPKGNVSDETELDQIDYSKTPFTEILTKVMSFMKKWKMVLLGLFGGFLEGLCFPLQGYIIGKIVTNYSLPGSENNLYWSMMMVLLGFVNFFGEFFSFIGFGFASADMIQRFRSKLLKGLLLQPISFFFDPKHSPTRIENILHRDARLAHNVVCSFSYDTAKAIVNVIVGLLISFNSSWHLSLIMLIAIPIIYSLTLYTSIVQKKFSNAEIETHQKYGRFVSNTISNLSIISTLCKENHFSSTHNKFSLNLSQSRLFVSLMNGFCAGLYEAISIGIFQIGINIGIQLMIYGILEQDQIIVVLLTMTLTIMNSFDIINSIRYSTGPAKFSIESCFNLLPNEHKIPKTIVNSIPSNIKSIAFDKVDFIYPFSEKLVLSNLSFKIDSPMKVSIVGKTGSGKSSILSLINNFFQPTNGHVTINDVEIMNWDTSILHKCVHLLPQNSEFMNTTIMDCLKYYNPDATIDQVISASKKAIAFDFIDSLPEKFDTMLGEDGILLSGGQKQRLALTRMYLSDPKVILLDEFTSAVDSQTEKLILTHLDRFVQDKICISVTHNLKHAIHSNLIIIVNNGIIEAMGNHSDCLKQSAWYRASQHSTKDVLHSDNTS
ncbi:P-loop containing nucleoside triphosphate hydrolase protein [Globomyces pollinis-pini]|nr:P-loop containing nucleoside triphosphate hydrolase protein [Globomyces pollinis-pini]